MQDEKHAVAKGKTVEELAREIIRRGYDVEIRQGKDGIKVFEVKKTLIATLPIR